MPDFLTRLAARPSDAPAGRRAGVPVRHADLLARIRAWCAFGKRSPARAVALYHEDSLEFAAALVGAWLAGKTVWLPADTLPATCAGLTARVDAFWGAFGAGLDAQTPAADDDWCGAWTPPGPDFAALVVFTSGSTGAPVPIPKRLEQLTAEVAALERQFGAIVGDADVVATVSHQHIYGLLFRVLWPLAAGRALHAARHEVPETLVPVLGARPCVLLASPAHLKRLPDHLAWQDAAARVRAVFSSGGMLEAGAAQHVARLLGTMPIEVYGSSESGGIAWRRRAGAASTGDEGWTPLPGVAWRRDDAGLLAVRSVPAGDGWLALADRVEDLGAGRFQLRGRADRIVKIEEKRVSLDAIEAALAAGGLVDQARVLACPGDPGARQVLAVFAVPTAAGRAVLEQDGKAALAARLRAGLAQGVEAVALPRRWRFLDALPVNAHGKTTAADLLALLDPVPAARPRHPAVRVLELAPARALLELTVPADLLYFDGHFAAAPVLPGVVQVDWAIHYGALHLGQDGVFAGMQALKFQQMIRPGQPVHLELARDAAKGQLNFRYFSEAGAHASGRVLFGPNPAC